MVNIATPQPGDEDHAGEWEQRLPEEEATYEYDQSEAYPAPRGYREETPSPLNYPSPMKSASSQFYSTPGMLRGNTSAGATPMPTQALRDVTSSATNSPNTAPFTPSPTGISSKFSDPSTPRAPLDDAERRKSHVLAVLSSSTLPSRQYRTAPRGTPHPLRRVSLAPTSDSITEEGSPSAWHMSNNTPRTQSRLSADQTGTHAANDSFVSIASSADLTSDRRATTTHHPRASRGHTSFPTILLPTGNASASVGGSLKGLSDQRADGVKIHKHLNAMNKQLLESNADLAREAEGWRDEVDRLKGLLQENGVEVEDVDVLGNISLEGNSEKMNALKRRFPQSPSGFGREGSLSPGPAGESGLVNRFREMSAERSARDILEGMTPEEHAAVMQEMAERLEMLEKGLDEKDALIDELEGQVAEYAGEEMAGLRSKLDEAERARVELQSEFALKTEQHAKQFGEICKGFESQIAGLQDDLRARKMELERLEGEKGRLEGLVNAGDAEGGVEIELRKQVQELGAELETGRNEINEQAGELERLQEQLEDLTRQRDEAEGRVEELQTELTDTGKLHSEDTNKLSAQLNEQREAQQAVEDDLAQRNDEMIELRQIADDQAAELERKYDEVEALSQKVQELEDELAEAAEDDKRAEVELSNEVDRLQQLLDETNSLLSEKEAEISNLMAQASRRSPSKSPVKASNQSVDDEVVKQLEDQLEGAFREIGRLKHELNASPHRKTAIEVKDARIKALEREKSVLSERLSAARNAASTPTGVQAAASPFKATPFVHRAIASLKTPKTPGPMREVSGFSPNLIS
jgi:hypothetical protein